MFCSKCGTEVPDDANFCWKCGQPQNVVPQGPPSDMEYDYLNIIDRPGGCLHFFTNVWEASVEGDVVEFVTYTTAVGFVQIARNRGNAHTELLSRLSRERWEALTTNNRGRVVSMRRPKRS